MAKIIVTLAAMLTLTTPTPAHDATVAELGEPPATSTVERLIRQEAKRQGVDEDMAVEIASCESGLRQFENGQVLRGKQNNQDIGIFQINEYYHLQAARESDIDIYTTDGNIQYAIGLMSKEGFKPWSWSQSCWQK